MTSIKGQSGFYGGKTFHLNSSDRIFIGRDRESCALLYPFDYNIISAIHCELSLDSIRNKLVIKDSGSLNGTFVDGVGRLEPNIKYYLSNGDGFYLAAEDNRFNVSIATY